MIKLLKWLLLATLTVGGLAWKVVQGFFWLMPGSVHRFDAPWDSVNERSTIDGRQIYD